MPERRETGIPQVHAARHGVPEPIAIVGMGARFPGASDVESFWKILADGRETVGEYPGGRFPYIDEVYSADSAFATRIASRRGGFLSGLDQFDAEFFGISPREAALLDPQQRLLLEVAWEAVDDAGLVREKLAGTRTGVFVGMWTNDYEDCLYEASPDVDFHATTGSGRYGASGRLAYFLDLRGPNLTLDTACSSSLVAIHLACQSLRAGECAIALAGGANAILRPEITLVYSDAGMLAPDGHCKFGDASADGYVRSEGAGIVILKRLSNALADGDSIYAVIRGSAVNNDGSSSGLLVSPSRKGQEDVIRSALEYAGVGVDEVAYVEAHGTGTLAGDPVEIETIGRVMSSADRTHACAIGSLKTNIGHTESAAGVAGVMKVALALDRGLVPASLHFREASPQIPWSELPIVVPTAPMQWPDTGRMPIAGVTGIGITGTNAHMVLQGVAPARPTSVSPDSSSRPFLFVLSAQTADALRAVASSWKTRLESDPSWPSSLADLAYTAAVRHSHHDYRLALTASDRDDLAKRLSAWLRGDELLGVVSDRRLQLASGKAVFVYPGQGGQWLGMGRTLFDREPVFRDALLRCDAAIAKHAGWSVVDELRATPETTRLDEIDIVQPTLFAVMVALTDLLRSLGVEPSAVVGHSMGEVAAAAVAGALTLDDAAAVICHRSRLMKRLRGRGAMAVVELDLDETREMIGDTERIWIGASNSATSTVISGDVDAIETMVMSLDAREIFCRRIKVDVASHSGHMDAVRDELESSLLHIQPRVGQLPIYSTTTGEIEDGSHLDAAYWGRNLRQTVLFHPAVQRLLADGFDAFVEINAHPVLTHSLSESVDVSGQDAVVTGSLRRDADEQVELLTAVGNLHVAGFPVNFGRMYPHGVSLRLPVYPWQRERHWFEGVPKATHCTSVRGSARDDDASRTDCLYDIGWVDATDTETPATVQPPGHWLVLAERGDIADKLTVELRATGATCSVFRPGATFASTGPDEYTVDPETCEGLTSVLDAAGHPLRGVIHLWTLVDVRKDDPDLDRIWAEQRCGSYSIPGIVRALAKVDIPQRFNLWLATPATQSVTAADTASGFAQGPLWGLGRVIAREHPELHCVNVDLSAAPDGNEIGHLVHLMTTGAPEDQLALRGKHVRIPRYKRITRQRVTSDVSIAPDGTYLITGGLSGIGLLTAQWLASQGARHLLLAARGEPSLAALRSIAQMELHGAAVRVCRTDVSNAQQVAALISMACDSAPLKGLFHLAVVTDDALLLDTTQERFQRVMSGKGAGAWNLYQATKHLDLDFAVFFSSIATVIAQPGQGTYAAANALVDAIATFARGRGFPALSIRWGPWVGGGLSSQEGKQRSVSAYAAQGVRPMTSDHGFAVMDRALAQGKSVVLAADIDWLELAEYGGDDPTSRAFHDLVPSRAGTAAHSVQERDVRGELTEVAQGRQRRALLEDFLRAELAKVLKVDPIRLDARKPFGAMGVDSLLAIEFTRRIAAPMALRIAATVVFNHPTIRALATEVARRMSIPLDSSVPIATPVDAVSIDRASSPREDISEEEAIRSLLGARGGTA